ncbi:unnamed protein product [Lactuca saligna]|uniref:EF-hand domain-containing protein n=1 Tax=Lactuca saligna TaxID=75948 RepID=A0AA35ZCY8_LACSI|nr:unnamed protein product [Lactuca saligna]
MSYSHYTTGNTTSPSAPPVPENQSQPGVGYPYQRPPQSQQSNYNYNYGQPQNPTSAGGYGSQYGYAPPTPSFPPGTHPEIIRNFQMVDSDRSGFIDAKELQRALSSGYQQFSLRTIRLLIFQFGNPADPHRIGPKEFSELWNCLGQWRAIFERFDRDRISDMQFHPTVLQLLIEKYDDQSGRRPDLSFDSFVECGMIVKGLTEKFKEKDTRYTGSATLSYETFMTMVIPFLAAE